MAPNSVELQALPSDTQEQPPVVPNKYGVGETSTSPRSSITVHEPITTHIHTILWPAFVFLIYAAFALFPWTALCIMSKRPIRVEKAYDSINAESFYPEHWYDVSEKYFKTAQILQSITTLITIPVTTAVCSMACVVYMQSSPLRRNLTLTQSMALADSGWLSPRILCKIASIGSLPLYAAFALTLFGSVSQITQSAFVNRMPVLATSGTPLYAYVYDTLALVDTDDFNRGSITIGFGQRTAALRSLLESPLIGNDDIHNWGVPYDPYESAEYVYSTGRAKDGGHTYVPLGSNFTSGAFPFQQFAPRINSSIAFENITEADFKVNCRNETDSGGFYARYYYVEPSIIQEGQYYSSQVDFEVCMTSDLRVSPWNITRDRQDISEELYYRTQEGYEADTSYWKITSTTSLGYFEVPSARNGRLPGPLLDKDPFINDITQIEKNRVANRKDTHLYRRAENISYSGNATMALNGYNKGPLASVAIALFGPASFIGARMSNPSNFVLPPDTISSRGVITGSGNCVYQAPLVGWLDSSVGSCIERDDSTDEHKVVQQVSAILNYFAGDYLPGTLGVLSQALFMANKLWMNQPLAGYRTENQLRIYYDDGIPTTKPQISDAGIIVGSVFLALHLLGLLLLATYIVMMKPWSGRMGSEIMLKMGMVYSDELARSETEHQWKTVLTKLPGFIGDERPEAAIGRMRLGAAAGLSRKMDRKFEILRQS